jgi:hypothetical protein
MPYYKFDDNDLLYNQIKTHPRSEFFIYSGSYYYNNRAKVSGSFTENLKHTSVGHISLHEMNVDRNNLIYPFVTKQGSRTAFKTVSTSKFNNDFSYGDEIASTYPLTASLHRKYFPASIVDPPATRNYINAIKNNLRHYQAQSPHFRSSTDLRNLNDTEINMLSVPSIFYGSSIRKGSVDLKFYVSGTLVAEASDKSQNGELIHSGPTGSAQSGSTIGFVMYNEGFIILTGNTAFQLFDDAAGTGVESQAHTDVYIPGESARTASWVHFGHTGSNASQDAVLSSSYSLSFEGTTYTPVLTMFAHAPRGMLNNSLNPTYIERNQDLVIDSSSFGYRENQNLKVKNTMSSSYIYDQEYQKQVFISKIGIYDENKNLIAIAKLAKPVRKTEALEYTFKLKYDL